MEKNERNAPSLRSKLANTALVGIKTSDWHQTDAGAEPLIKAKAKVGDKLRPVVR